MKGEIERYPLTGRFLMGRLRHALSDREKDILEDAVSDLREYPDGHRILARGELCHRSTILIEGFINRSIFENGRRYIVGIQVPGDFVDLHGFALKRLDHDIVTAGPARIGLIDHARLNELMASEPHLSRLFWFSTLLDAALHRQWVLKLEQLKANRRVAHLMAELWHRLAMVGLAGPTGFRSPLTQIDLADMCGTTPVHMNRAIGELRRLDVADFRRGTVSFDDRAKLERHGDFDATYLYGEGALHIGNELRE
ncbi:Crp/Fnr family transcriptional regulator [Pelagerythrobacter sp.]|uniref:Crp/Fnr family transcriptional regulator n=1 Tax=Pelagerythrobacter sp. TaxID=2800702 RepID=UPI0035AD9C01